MKKKYIGKINGIDYNTYINSIEWREKRTEVAERAKYKCNRWYTGEKEPEPIPESYISVKNTPYYKSCIGRNVDRSSRGI